MCLVFPNYGLSLYEFLRKNRYRGFSLQHVRDFAKNLLKAVAFLHDMKLIHTDLKPENILLKNSDYYESENVRLLGRVCFLLFE
jgi:dual-specificity kinase